MDDTFQTTSGRPRLTRGRPAVRLRAAGLVITALIGSLLITWVSRTTWGRVENLRQEFSGLKQESFYLGIRMRNDIQRLDDTLLRYRLHGDATDIEIFHGDSQAFQHELDRAATNATTTLERKFIRQIGTAYAQYLEESKPILAASRGFFESTQAREFKESYEKVQQQSQYLLSLCDTFIDNQRTAFNAFVQDSNRTLASFQRLLKLALALLLALAAALVMFVYRDMIAPLRHQLTESQALIARQEKLASLGVLAAGVAHEIRNPLTAIKFRLFSLRKTLPDAATEDATVIGNEISRLERIVKDFLQFARPSEPVLVDVPAVRVLQEVCELLRPQLEKNAIVLQLDSCDSIWVRVDMQQIKQVLINLVQNSAEVIGTAGVISLRAHSPAPASRNGPRLALLEVSDTGKGIPPEVQERLFDPFFTTKEGGTGLGLPIAARIVEKHHGELRYHTTPGRGTTFVVTLPGYQEHETQDSAH